MTIIDPNEIRRSLPVVYQFATVTWWNRQGAYQYTLWIQIEADGFIVFKVIAREKTDEEYRKDNERHGW